MDALMFLIKLAWESRYRLPMILTVGFLALDIRMQLEINIHTRTVMRGRPPQRHPRNNQGGGNPQQVGQEGEGRQVRNPEENIASDGWETMDEYELNGEDTDEDEGHEYVSVEN